MPGDKLKPKKTVSLAEIALEDGACRDDFNLTDRYQSFSSELVRVALLGIAVCGFLLKTVYFADKHDAFLAALKTHGQLFQFGVVCLAASAASALLHRYFSSDSMAFQVGYLRLRELRDKTSEGEKEYQDFNSRMAKEKRKYRWRLKICGWLLLLSTMLLGIGAVSLAFTFSQTLFVEMR